MRRVVLAAYPGPKWKKRVEKMQDSQLIAVYYNIMNKEVSASSDEKHPIIIMPRNHGRSIVYQMIEEYKQLSMFD